MHVETGSSLLASSGPADSDAGCAVLLILSHRFTLEQEQNKRRSKAKRETTAAAAELSESRAIENRIPLLNHSTTTPLPQQHLATTSRVTPPLLPLPQPSSLLFFSPISLPPKVPRRFPKGPPKASIHYPPTPHSRGFPPYYLMYVRMHFLPAPNCTVSLVSVTTPDPVCP